MAATMMTTLPQFNGLRLQLSASPAKSLTTYQLKDFSDTLQAAVQPMRRKGNGALGARMDFIGSPTNLVTISFTSFSLSFCLLD
uniref:Uncharacterized protein MANES_14G134800 n=1 Tax=Rhizophora mucronata TaxID=61149 RepID=A0A2P2KRJ6_RHIMU